MLPKITVTVTNHNPGTIFGRLAAKLGRSPTNEECKHEIHKILDEQLIIRAGKGKMRHQRK